jgi:GTP-binding protein Era
MSARSGFVAVVGRPNVGKSTLVNALVGQKVAIVSDKPQTTRNRILAVVNRPGGQIVLFDTPGIHKPEHRLNRRMVDVAVKSLDQVDLVLWLADMTQDYGPGDRFVCEALRRSGKPVMLGLNKIDTVKKPRILTAIDRYRGLLPFVEIVPLSALTGDNVELLGERLLAQLPEGPPLYPHDFLTDQPERFFVAEMIREQILHLTRQELPHSTAVVIDSFQDPSDTAAEPAEGEAAEGEPRDAAPARGERAPLVRIEATILVERDSQKAIVIGRGGSLLKAVGSAARREIEAFLGARVYLGLFVRVRSHWREDPHALDQLGLPGRE